MYPKDTAVWAYSKEQYEMHIRDNLLYWGTDGKAKSPRFKKFLTNHQGVVNRTLWHYDDVGHTQGATSGIKRILQNGFPTPKPTTLIERILKISTHEDAIVLDSFAGSGTTAHAVLNMNKADGGNRKFILIEMEDYADSITAERVKRVISGYGESKNAVDGTGGAFSYYDLGDALLLQDGNLNEEVGVAKIREYVWYMETKETFEQTENPDMSYYLGLCRNTAYYFYYEKDKVTTLDHDFLSDIKKKADSYIIYADLCTIPEDELKKWSITFKKIPRDIAKL